MSCSSFGKAGQEIRTDLHTSFADMRGVCRVCRIIASVVTALLLRPEDSGIEAVSCPAAQQ